MGWTRCVCSSQIWLIFLLIKQIFYIWLSFSLISIFIKWSGISPLSVPLGELTTPTFTGQCGIGQWNIHTVHTGLKLYCDYKNTRPVYFYSRQYSFNPVMHCVDRLALYLYYCKLNYASLLFLPDCVPLSSPFGQANRNTPYISSHHTKTRTFEPIKKMINHRLKS